MSGSGKLGGRDMKSSDQKHSQAPGAESSPDAPAPAGNSPVGYGSPPVATRFPHQRGTRGRRKGSKNMKTLAREAFEASVNAKVNGKSQKMTKKELILHQLATQASSGNLKAIDRALPLIERYLEGSTEAEPAPEKTLHHRSVLKNLIALDKMFDDGETANG